MWKHIVRTFYCQEMFEMSKKALGKGNEVSENSNRTLYWFMIYSQLKKKQTQSVRYLECQEKTFDISNQLLGKLNEIVEN